MITMESHIHAGDDFHFYDLLGVKSYASKEEIQAAYFHQSILITRRTADQAEALTKMTKTKLAYEVLMDDRRRRLYDEMMNQNAALQIINRVHNDCDHHTTTREHGIYMNNDHDELQLISEGQWARGRNYLETPRLALHSIRDDDEDDDLPRTSSSSSPDRRRRHKDDESQHFSSSMYKDGSTAMVVTPERVHKNIAPDDSSNTSSDDDEEMMMFENHVQDDDDESVSLLNSSRSYCDDDDISSISSVDVNRTYNPGLFIIQNNDDDDNGDEDDDDLIFNTTYNKVSYSQNPLFACVPEGFILPSFDCVATKKNIAATEQQVDRVMDAVVDKISNLFSDTIVFDSDKIMEREERYLKLQNKLNDHDHRILKKSPPSFRTSRTTSFMVDNDH